KKLAQNEKEVNNSNAITTFSPLTTQNIEIVYRNREQEQNSKSTWLPSLGAEAVNVSYTYMQKQTEKSMRKEFDHWMNRSQEEKTIKRVKRNLDRPIESPATSVAEFTSFISGEMELIPQPEFDAYISRIAKSGFSSADAQQGFKKLLGAMDTVDKINSLKAPNLSNQGHELKMRIVAATHRDNPGYTKGYETTKISSLEENIELLRALGVNGENLGLITDEAKLLNALIVIKVSNERLVSNLGESRAFVNQYILDSSIIDSHVRWSQELLTSPDLHSRFDTFFSSWSSSLSTEEKALIMNNPRITAPEKLSPKIILEGSFLSIADDVGISHGLSLCIADAVHRHGAEHAVKFTSSVQEFLVKAATEGQMQELTQLGRSLHHLSKLSMSVGETDTNLAPTFLERADYKTRISAEEMYNLLLTPEVKEGTTFFVGFPKHKTVLVKGFTGDTSLTPVLTFFDPDTGMFPLFSREQAIYFLQGAFDNYGSTDTLAPMTSGTGRAVIVKYNPTLSDQVIPALGSFPLRDILSDVPRLISASTIRRSNPLESLITAIAESVDPITARHLLRARSQPSITYTSHTHESGVTSPDIVTSNRNLASIRAVAAEIYTHIDVEIIRAGVSSDDALVDIRNLFRSASEENTNIDSDGNISIKIWSAEEATNTVNAPLGTETRRAQLEAFFKANAERAVATIKVKVGLLYKINKLINLMYPPTIVDTVMSKLSGLVTDILNIVSLCEMYASLNQISNLPADQQALFIINYSSSLFNMLSASAQWSAFLTEQISALTASSAEVASKVAKSTGSVITKASIGSAVGSMIVGGINTGFAIKSMTEAKTSYQFGKATADLASGLASIGLGIVGLAFPGFGAIIAGISLVIVALKHALTKYFQQATVGFYKAIKGFCQTDMEIKAIVELLMGNWITNDNKVIHFNPSIPIDSVIISGSTIVATKTNNSFQLRPMYDKYYGINSRLSLQQIAKIRFSFDRMLEKKPISIKKIYPHLNLQKIVQQMHKKSLLLAKNNESETKIMILPQGKPVNYHPSYESFTFGLGAPDRKSVLNKFKYINVVTVSPEDFFRIQGATFKKYYPLVNYVTGLGGIIAVSYDRGYYDHDSKHETFVTVGIDSPSLMIPPALDFPLNQIGITGVMHNSWNRNALTRDYTFDVKPNSTATLIANPNANVKFRNIHDSSKIGLAEWYPGQIEEVKIAHEDNNRYTIVLEMKPTPVQKSKGESQDESPFDQWRKHLPECKLEDPDPQDHKNTDYSDPLAGRAKTTTKISIPNGKVITLNLAEKLDHENRKEYHSLTCAVEKEGIKIDFVGNPGGGNTTASSKFTNKWIVGEAKKIKTEVETLLRKNPKTGPEAASSSSPTNIIWKPVTSVYDLSCRENPDAEIGQGWIVSPKNLTDADQKQDDIYPELKKEHVIPVCLSSEVKNRYGNSSNEWKDIELIWIQEPQINDRIEYKNEKWREFGTYYFFSKEKSLLLKQIDDHQVQLDQVSISYIHPKQLIDKSTGKSQVVPGEMALSPQGIDGGSNGKLFIATEDAATNATFINKTLDFQEKNPLSTILVPNVPLLYKNGTEMNYTMIQTNGETFIVPIDDKHNPRLVGTFAHNDTKIAVIKSSAPARSKRDLHNNGTQPIKLHLVDPFPQDKKTLNLEEEQLPQLKEIFKGEEILDVDINSLLNIMKVRLSPGILVGLQISPNSIGEWHQRMQLLGVGIEIWNDLQKNENKSSYIKQKLESLFSKYGTSQQRFFPIPTPEAAMTEGNVSTIMWYDTTNFQIFTIDWSLVKSASPIGETALEKTPQVYQVVGYSQKERQLLYATTLAKNTPLDLLASISIGGNNECSNKVLKFLSLQDAGNYHFIGKLWQSHEGKIQYQTPPLPGVTHLTLLSQNKRDDGTPAVELIVPEEAMEYLKSITLVNSPGLSEEEERLTNLKFNSAGYTEFMDTHLDPVVLKIDGLDLVMEILKPKKNPSDQYEGPEYFITRFEHAFDNSWSLHPRCGDIVTVGTKTYSWLDLKSMLPNADFSKNDIKIPDMETL
ncbi:putative membrane protein (partial), partial [Candidatus Ichthyocystis hellenicum]